MTDADILKKYVDFYESGLCDKEKEIVYLTLIKYNDAFSFKAEIVSGQIQRWSSN